MSMIKGLQPWEYEVSAGFKLRGWHSEPSGRPLLHFIHGNGFCGLTYEKLLAPLAQHFDLFISDAQGHGDSDSGGKYAGWNRSARYSSEAWSHYSRYWKAVPKIASGHSYGAVMSSVMMAKQPELFDRAILLDPTFAPRMTSNTIVLMSQFGLTKRMTLPKQAAVRTTRWENEDALWHYFHERGVFKGWDEDCLRSYLTHAMRREADGSIHLKCPPQIESAIFASYPKSLWRSLRAVQVPVTVMYGAQTFPFILKALPILAKQNPHFSLVEMPGGHCFMQEDPEASSQVMQAELAPFI